MPAHDSHTLRHKLACAFVRTLAEIVSVAGVVPRVEHVVPRPELRVRTHRADRSHLACKAPSENVRHVRVLRLARGTCAARADFVKVKEPSLRTAQRRDVGGSLREVGIEASVAHACGHLSVLQARWMVVVHGNDVSLAHAASPRNAKALGQRVHPRAESHALHRLVVFALAQHRAVRTAHDKRRAFSYERLY